MDVLHQRITSGGWDEREKMKRGHVLAALVITYLLEAQESHAEICFHDVSWWSGSESKLKIMVNLDYKNESYRDIERCLPLNKQGDMVLGRHWIPQKPPNMHYNSGIASRKFTGLLAWPASTLTISPSKRAGNTSRHGAQARIPDAPCLAGSSLITEDVPTLRRLQIFEVALERGNLLLGNHKRPTTNNKQCNSRVSFWVNSKVTHRKAHTVTKASKEQKQPSPSSLRSLRKPGCMDLHVAQLLHTSSLVWKVLKSSAPAMQKAPSGTARQTKHTNHTIQHSSPKARRCSVQNSLKSLKYLNYKYIYISYLLLFSVLCHQSKSIPCLHEIWIELTFSSTSPLSTLSYIMEILAGWNNWNVPNQEKAFQHWRNAKRLFSSSWAKVFVAARSNNVMLSHPCFL